VHLVETGSIVLGGTGSVNYHHFTLTEAATIRIVVPKAAFTPNLYLLRDDGMLDTSDVVTYVRGNNNAGIERTLTAGDYILAIGAATLNSDEVVSGINSADSAAGSGAYTLRIDTVGTWLPTDPLRNWGLDGFMVDLDVADVASPHYRISSNSDESLIIDTADDLSSAVGKELVGIHNFETLNVTGGAQLDFGDDQVIINDLQNSTIDSSSSVTAGANSVLP
jgi:hypothetical protein